MWGPAEIIYQLIWKLCPQSLRVKIAHKVQEADRRALIEVPANQTTVYSCHSSIKEAFPNAVEPSKDLSLPAATLIATCKDESASIPAWVESLKAQSVQPSKIIICDGGSSDNSVKLLEESLEAEVFVLPGANIARGRNEAIKRAETEIIVCTDLGCTLEKDWFERMLEPFAIDSGLELCGGYYDVDVADEFSAAVAHFIVPKLSQIEASRFLPSGRSIAFKKDIWEQVSGFPEDLSFAGEDSLFSFRAKEVAKKFAFVPDARVSWKMSGAHAKTIYRYAKGDAEGKTLFWRHYLWLSREYLKVGFEFVLGLVLLLIYVPAAAVLILLSLIRLYLVLRKFQPFKDCAEGGRLYRLAAVILVSASQAIGFLVPNMRLLLRKPFSHRSMSPDSQ